MRDKLDKDGYLLLETEFVKKGFEHVLVNEMDDNWRIYRRNKEGSKFIHYELVYIKKQPEYAMAGVIVSKRYSYPSSNSWGSLGFTFHSLEECHKKYDKIKKEKKVKED